MNTAQLERDYALTDPVANLIAEQLSSSAVRANGRKIASADLARMITGIGEDLTLQGAPELEVDFLDNPNFDLLNSSLFRLDANGRLANVALNYPHGSRFWWRLLQVSPRRDQTIRTFWIPSIVRRMMDL